MLHVGFMKDFGISEVELGFAPLFFRDPTQTSQQKDHRHVCKFLVIVRPYTEIIGTCKTDGFCN